MEEGDELNISELLPEPKDGVMKFRLKNDVHSTCTSAHHHVGMPGTITFKKIFYQFHSN